MVGDSRLGHLPDSLRPALLSPASNPVIKEERETLVWRLELPAGGAGVVKLYRQRGALNRLRGRVVPFRVQREFNALRVLADGGIPCSLPLLWGRGRATEHGYFELLLTREIPQAVSLKQHLSAGGAPFRPEDWASFADSLRRMHEHGVYHGALWPKNILLTRAADGTTRFYVVDLARAVRFRGTICGTTMARFDWLSLLGSLARAETGLDWGAMLRRYGYAPAEAEDLARQARRHRSSRHLRNRLALAFQLRAVLDWR